MELIIVAAVAANGVIGKDNRLLWHLPADLKHFKALTLGHPVIMGRKTWESLPEKFRPLPGRRNIVISRNARYSAGGAEVFASFDEALATCTAATTVCVIGGGELYALTLPRAARLELTELAASYEGDARFPDFDRGSWREIAREPQHDEASDIAFDFVTYTRP